MEGVGAIAAQRFMQLLFVLEVQPSGYLFRPLEETVQWRQARLCGVDNA